MTNGRFPEVLLRGLALAGTAAVLVTLAPGLRAQDTGDYLEVYPYLGLAVDNFAASDVTDYLNIEESGDVKTRETFGIAFQYPLFNEDAGTSRATPVSSFDFEPSLWIYGQTTHGVRSADVDCEANENNPLCTPFGSQIIDAKNDPTRRALYVLRNASSLEAMLGLRFEFATLPNNNARLYIAAQTGFVAVEDDDDDVADINHIGLGIRVTDGRYKNSYLEIGKGESDLFVQNPNDRSKINARLVTRPGFLNDKAIFFAHMVADVDGSDGADSIQTYLGFAFCFGKGGRGSSGACAPD